MPKFETPKGLPAGRQGAISILLTILILSVVLVIAFGISSVLLRQIKMSGQTSDSVWAYQAADSGIEYALYQANNLSTIGNLCSGCTLGTDCPRVGDAFYCLATDNPNFATWIKSFGQFKQTQRSVEVGAIEVGEGE